MRLTRSSTPGTEQVLDLGFGVIFAVVVAIGRVAWQQHRGPIPVCERHDLEGRL